jgi:hypothetical protein
MESNYPCEDKVISFMPTNEEAPQETTGGTEHFNSHSKLSVETFGGYDPTLSEVAHSWQTNSSLQGERIRRIVQHEYIKTVHSSEAMSIPGTINRTVQITPEMPRFNDLFVTKRKESYQHYFPNLDHTGTHNTRHQNIEAHDQPIQYQLGYMQPSHTFEERFHDVGVNGEYSSKYPKLQQSQLGSQELFNKHYHNEDERDAQYSLFNSRSNEIDHETKKVRGSISRCCKLKNICCCFAILAVLVLICCVFGYFYIPRYY